MCYWWLKQELEAECVNQYTGILKQIINTWRTMIKTSYLMYLDANNLYGWAMSRF